MPPQLLQHTRKLHGRALNTGTPPFRRRAKSYYCLAIRPQGNTRQQSRSDGCLCCRGRELSQCYPPPPMDSQLLLPLSLWGLCPLGSHSTPVLGMRSTLVNVGSVKSSVAPPVRR
jgi:hypothetical protein